MATEEMLVSKSETIGIPQIRQLIEAGQIMNMILTDDEFIQIMSVYSSAANRILKENEVE